MPDLDTSLHLNMLAEHRRERLYKRFLRAFRQLRSPLYGLQWGDPDLVPPLKFIKEQYVLPYVKANHVAVEIGPGGGRWTRYLCGFKTLYAVDYHGILLDELRRNFGKCRNIKFVKNNGTDFPEIPQGSIDYLFSFGTFVHLDFNLIEAYLVSIKPIIKPHANVVIQYSDKTKVMGQAAKSFSENTPEQMRTAILANGYRILEEDTTSLWHSSVVRFGI
jgi:hypothetical protein